MYSMYYTTRLFAIELESFTHEISEAIVREEKVLNGTYCKQNVSLAFSWSGKTLKTPSIECAKS